MYQAIIIIHVLLGLGIVGLIMIQQGKGADTGASFGTGASATVFGSQGAGTFLTRTTAIFASLFFATSLGLAFLSGKQGQGHDLMAEPPARAGTVPVIPVPDKPAPEQTLPVVPAAPVAPKTDPAPQSQQAPVAEKQAPVAAGDPKKPAAQPKPEAAKKAVDKADKKAADQHKKPEAKKPADQP